MPDVAVQTGERKKRVGAKPGPKPGTKYVHRTPSELRRRATERQRKYRANNPDIVINDNLARIQYRKEYYKAQYQWRTSQFYKFLCIDPNLFN
jgi:hypothetical protein